MWGAVSYFVPALSEERSYAQFELKDSECYGGSTYSVIQGEKVHVVTKLGKYFKTADIKPGEVIKD